METKTVIATKHPVPMENNSHRYITTDTPVTVDWTTYYVRRFLDGEIAEAGASSAPPASTASAKGGK